MLNPAEKLTIGDSFESYGCQVNALDIDQLFGRYEKAGFLYPAKMTRLAPFLPIVKDNWRRARRGGELLLWVATYEDGHASEWSSIASWLSTTDGWVTQHLVSIGSPLASRAVMLAAQAVRLKDGDTSHQSWFRRGNRYANKIFGSVTRSVGPEHSWVGDYGYYTLHPRLIGTPCAELRVFEATRSDLTEIQVFVAECRLSVFVEAEDLKSDDLGLDAVDQIYRRVGLRRYRKVFLVRDRALDIVGVALAYRGPLGINFSFLENRCDLILRPHEALERASLICTALCGIAAGTYTSFEPEALHLTIDTRLSGALGALGAQHIRDYAQSIWTKGGFVKWYRHTEGFYDAFLESGKRRGFGRIPSASGSFR
jgi:hypothetical protein